MARFNTVEDLISHALFRSGEFTAGALADGDFYNGTDGGPVLGYINDCVEGLILGGFLGLQGENGMPLPAVDWWWARKQPPGVLTLNPAITTGTVSAVQGQSTITFSSLLSVGSAIVGTFIVGSGIVGGPVDLTGYRIRIGDSRVVPRIISTSTNAANTATTAELDAPWPDATISASPYVAAQLEYDLADDFVRFTGEPTLSADPWSCPVMDVSTMEDQWPISMLQGGVPQAAALITPSKIRLSHYVTTLTRVEYNYVYLPDRFVFPDTDPAQDLILPPVYRRILPVGAAYYVNYDKADNKAGDMMGEAKAIYRTMVSEHNRHQRKMSQGFGRINYRLGQVRGLPGQGPLRTASGLIIGP